MKVTDVWRKHNTAIRHGFGAVAVMAMLGAASQAYADPPYTMAPPVYSDSSDYAAAPVDSESVFDWRSTPQSERVEINRASFDQGGYQLFDTRGETIVVPFSNHNLYVMKFARSDDGSMYFVNYGDYPVLYLPRHAYLENASTGGKWYPFTDEFYPETPVYVGIAPSWSAFVEMGWYPDMACWGGYYGYRPYYEGSLFIATPGFLFSIGGFGYHRWHDYDDYCRRYPAPYHIGWWSRDAYGWAQQNRGRRDFRGGYGDRIGDRGGHFDGHRPFMGSGHPYYGNRTPQFDRTFNHGPGSSRGPIVGRGPGGGTFNGGRGPGGGRVFTGGRDPGTVRHFDGGRGPQTYRNFGETTQPYRHFDGGTQPYRQFGRGTQPYRQFDGGTQPYRQFGGGTQPYRQFDGGQRSYQTFDPGPRSYRSFNAGPAPQPFHNFDGVRPGGGSRSYSAPRPNYGGGGGGGRSYGGNVERGGGGGNRGGSDRGGGNFFHH